MSKDISTLQILISFFRIGIYSLKGNSSLKDILKKESKKLNIDNENLNEILIFEHNLCGLKIINLSLNIGYKINRKKGVIVALIGAIMPIFIFSIFIISIFNFIEKEIFLHQKFYEISNSFHILLLLLSYFILIKVNKKHRNIIIFVLTIVLLRLEINPSFFVISLLLFRFCNINI